MHPYSIIDTTAAWKKLRFILSGRSDFYMSDRLLLAVHAFGSRVLHNIILISKTFWQLLLYDDFYSICPVLIKLIFKQCGLPKDIIVIIMSCQKYGYPWRSLSLHFSLSFIAFGRSPGLHPVSSHNCCMYVRAGRPAFAWPYAGVHRSTSLMSSSLLLQQCSTCLVRLTCIVFVMGGRWPYSWCLVGCCLQSLWRCPWCNGYRRRKWTRQYQKT